MIGYARRAVWIAGWPVRFALLLFIRAYRLSLGYVIGGNCRFYPSCSAYAQEAVERCGAIRGSAVAVWRVLRCSPLSTGGVDPPPQGRLYDVLIQRRPGVARRGIAA